MYSVTFTNSAKKDLKNLPYDVQDRIREELEEIREDPRTHVKPLEIPSDIPTYSLRVGKYRVLMNIIRSQLIIRVVGIGLRKKVYKNLR
jgi:mRNA interferase RelE/StbE